MLVWLDLNREHLVKVLKEIGKYELYREEIIGLDSELDQGRIFDIMVRIARKEGVLASELEES